LASDHERYTHTIDPESATETNLAESISFLPSQKIHTQFRKQEFFLARVTWHGVTQLNR
jgi:hypothetical protein